MEPLAEKVLQIASRHTGVADYDIDCPGRKNEQCFARWLWWKALHEIYGWGVCRIARTSSRVHKTVSVGLDQFDTLPAVWRKKYRPIERECRDLLPPGIEDIDGPKLLRKLGAVSQELDQTDWDIIRALIRRASAGL